MNNQDHNFDTAWGQARYCGHHGLSRFEAEPSSARWMSIPALCAVMQRNFDVNSFHLL